MCSQINATIYLLCNARFDKCIMFQPEGETQYSNKAVFVDLKNKNSFNTSITLDIPNNIVEGSDIVEISAIGM